MNIQEVIRELKSGTEAKSIDTTPTIEFDFKAKFAETKAAAKVCQLFCLINIFPGLFLTILCKCKLHFLLKIFLTLGMLPITTVLYCLLWLIRLFFIPFY